MVSIGLVPLCLTSRHVVVIRGSVVVTLLPNHGETLLQKTDEGVSMERNRSLRTSEEGGSWAVRNLCTVRSRLESALSRCQAAELSLKGIKTYNYKRSSDLNHSVGV